MPMREIAGKSLAFGLAALVSVAAGVLVLIGPHAYNDYIAVPLGVALILFGAFIGGMGSLIVFGIVADARLRRREEALHITPRPGPLAPPPPWGMGDVGRPARGGAVRVGEEPEGRDRGLLKATATLARGGAGGGPRVMSVTTTRLEAPLVLFVLVVWTVGFLVWLAPR